MAYGDNGNSRPYNGYGNNRNFDSTRGQQRPNHSAYRSQDRYASPPPVEPPVVEVKKPIDPTTRDIIIFKGNFYDVPMLLKQTGPMITVPENELNDVEENAAKASRDLPEDVLNYSTPVFAKYEGKYVVLLGAQALEKAVKEKRTIVGRFLSNPTLKRAIAV